MRNIIIDYTKPKGYKTKDWIAMETLQEKSKGKITKWRSATGNGGFFNVKKGFLYYDNYPIQESKSWGETRYRLSNSAYNTASKDFIKGYLKKYLLKFKVKKLLNNY